MMISTDQLQNEILNIAHHLDDIEKAVRKGDAGYALEGLKDAKEAIARLNKFLPSGMENEMKRMSEDKISDIAGMITEDPDILSETPTSSDEDIAEGHHYLRKTSRSQEKKLNRANERASRASGMPGYERLNAQRNDLIGQAEQSRPLRRNEFINKYGYDAWLEYTRKHGLPETHKWADAEM